MFCRRNNSFGTRCRWVNDDYYPFKTKTLHYWLHYIKHTDNGRSLQCPSLQNHICPLHAEVTARSHLSGSVMIGITHTHMHWTICAINPEPSSETKKTRVEKDLNGPGSETEKYALLWWHLLKLTIDFICTKEVSWTQQQCKHHIIFTPCCLLHRHNHSHLSHINSYTESWWISSRENDPISSRGLH